MKRNLSLTLAILLTGSLLLTGCGTDSKYETLISYLDRGDYQSAIYEIQNLQKAEIEAGKGDVSYEHVLTTEELQNCFSVQKLTTDNWQEYLETETVSEDYTDQFGDKTGETAEHMNLKLRENVGLLENMEIVIQYEYSVHSTSAFYTNDGTLISDYEPNDDYETRQLTLNYRNRSTFLMQTYYKGAPDSSTGWINNEERKGYNEYHYEISDLTITRIEGDIVLAEIPDEIWNTDEEGRFLAVITEDQGIVKFYDNGKVIGEYYRNDPDEDMDTDIFYNLNTVLDPSLLSNG